MYCAKCGTQLEENAQICPNCSAVIAQESVEKAPEETTTEVAPTPGKWSGKSITGFVLSLVGILIAAIPCGIIGLVFSALGLNDTGTKALRGKGLAISGLVVSIVDIVIGFLYLV